MVMERLTIFGTADGLTVDQMRNCMSVEDGSIGVLCADNHLGYSQPIGGAVAYREHISPSGVGYDIGCGNKAVLTNLKASEIDVSKVMDEIVSRISFGVGRKNNDPVDYPVLDKINDANFKEQRKLLSLAKNQLGTVGAGNHYVDLFADNDDNLWVGVHFGSRGFGHKTASGFLAMAQGKSFNDQPDGTDMMSPPVVFRTDSAMGQDYIEAMKLAGDYAYAGRDIVCDIVLDILGAEYVDEFHNHHNFAWYEEHDGEMFWVIRKGCTPAFPGQFSFVGSSMGENSVILMGTDNNRESLFSTVHGAGRVMSRSEATGKQRKRWTCNTRDCDWVQGHGEHKPDTCPKCNNSKMSKRWIQVKEGKVDFGSVKEEIRKKGIELRGGSADEAPEAYKRLSEVLAEHGDTIEIVYELRPIGVAMAGPDTFDPFKD